MAILSPEHLFEQADRLIVRPVAGPPRQVDIRRAVSSAYYGVFHAIVTAATDELVKRTNFSKPWYALVYRSADHKTLRDVCQEALKSKASTRYSRYMPRNGFAANIRDVAAALLDLQEKRHLAEYDPSIRLRTSDAILAINTARAALSRLNDASGDQKTPFLYLVLFSPR